MEVSFAKEVEALRLGRGATFHGEGILAITKALLQSGVAYVGGYQGAPVSHLLDVMVQAERGIIALVAEDYQAEREGRTSERQTTWLIRLTWVTAILTLVRVVLEVVPRLIGQVH